MLKLEEKLKEFAENRKKELDKIEEKAQEKKAKGSVQFNDTLFYLIIVLRKHPFCETFSRHFNPFHKVVW